MSNITNAILYWLSEITSIGVSFSFCLIIVKYICVLCDRQSEVGPSYDKLSGIVMKSTIVLLVAEMILSAILK